ncbi:MAG: Dyp-type peroxidase [Gammaproteobacteria bacterium]|nr:Dyp-type peroxidase [Gammaproteobacteria bacterium]
MNCQPGILAPTTDHAIYLEYGIISILSIGKSLETLSEELKDTEHIVGIGTPLVDALNVKVPGLKAFSEYSNSIFNIPITQNALFVVLRGNDAGQLNNLAITVNKAVSDAFAVADKTKGFEYQGGRDLTGYENGTGNPDGEEAISTAIVNNGQKSLHGSSYVSIQRWVHDFDKFNAMEQEEQDKRIGRYRNTNAKFDAPRYAHARKIAQESFTPEAYVLRRSMPWADDRGRGLFFVAFSSSLRAFDVQMKSMMGFEDDIQDGLFDFSMPATGANYWCPPLHDGKLDLSLVLSEKP